MLDLGKFLTKNEFQMKVAEFEKFFGRKINA
jgi:hypothetical protein